MSQQKPYLCLGRSGLMTTTSGASWTLTVAQPIMGWRMKMETSSVTFLATIILQIWMESLLFAPVGRAIIPHISILTARSSSAVHSSISLTRLPRRTACLWHISLPKRTKSHHSASQRRVWVIRTCQIKQTNIAVGNERWKEAKGGSALPGASTLGKSQTCLESNSSPLKHRETFIRLRYFGILNTQNSLCRVKIFTFWTKKIVTSHWSTTAHSNTGMEKMLFWISTGSFEVFFFRQNRSQKSLCWKKIQKNPTSF